MIKAQSILIKTSRAVLEFAVDEEGMLIQRGFGGLDSARSGCDVAYPAAGDGWTFEPALRVTHADGNTSTDLRVMNVSAEGGLTRISLQDPAYRLFLDLMFQAYSEEDVIEAWMEIRHDEPTSITLHSFASSSQFFGPGDWFLTQFRGDWNDEMKMEEEKLGYGLKILDSKLGVRAHQFQSPWFLLGEGHPITETEGEVFAGSLAWSGSFQFAFEKLPSGSLHAICGINPFASEFHLEAEECFMTPRMVWAHSENGTRELTHKLHRWTRANVLREPGRPHSIILNNWEATHFNFDQDKIAELCAGAEEIGVETFLLDDGWFGSAYPRNSDSQGLGDWETNLEKFPDGIGAAVNAATSCGLRFGIWVEPEMVSPRSSLFVQHPDWVVQQPKRTLEPQRNQLVLDLTRPEVRSNVFGVVDRLLSENPGISYIKWDCNRHLTQPGSLYLAANRQSHLWIEYVRALDHVFTDLVAKHPNVEIMMCAGGGGRIDYGSMRFAHELWPSDNTDPVRRIFIQWGYSHFYPAIAISAHVTRMGNRPLKFAFDVAMSGRLGMDINLAEMTPEELAFSARAIATYKEIRNVVQFGKLYRLESPYTGARSSLMYVHEDSAILFVFALGANPTASLSLAGLDDNRDYMLTEINRLDGAKADSFGLSGSDLRSAGLSIPDMVPLESHIYEIRFNG